MLFSIDSLLLKGQLRIFPVSPIQMSTCDIIRNVKQLHNDEVKYSEEVYNLFSFSQSIC